MISLWSKTIGLQRLQVEGIQLVDVGVEYPVDEADARAFVGVLIGELDMDFPETALKGGCDS
jgi:hypothetical protein